MLFYNVFTYNFYGDMSMLGYLVMAVIIGYMGGALANGSMNFKRLLGAGMTAAVITATIQAYLNYTVSLSPARTMNHSNVGKYTIRITRIVRLRIAIYPQHCFRSNHPDSR